MIRKVGYWLLVCLLCAPLALIITFILPVWDWIEQLTGIESMGHSGPATWCFGAIYIVILAIWVMIKCLNAPKDA